MFKIIFLGVEKEGQTATIEYSYNGTVRTKKLPLWGKHKDVGEFFLGVASPQDTVFVETSKNDKGYTDWISVTNSEKEAAAKPSSSGPYRPPGKAASPDANRFETPEERAKRQVYIIRQSSLERAVDILGPAKDLEEYIQMATRITTWVTENPTRHFESE